jgi:hypothetical protein
VHCNNAGKRESDVLSAVLDDGDGHCCLCMDGRNIPEIQSTGFGDEGKFVILTPWVPVAFQ